MRKKFRLVTHVLFTRQTNIRARKIDGQKMEKDLPSKYETIEKWNKFKQKALEIEDTVFQSPERHYFKPLCT